MMKFKFPFRMSLRYFRKLVKYLIIIFSLVFIYYTLYIILKPFRHKLKLRSNSFVDTGSWTMVPKLGNGISRSNITSTAEPEVETCQIAKIDNISENSNTSRLVKEQCHRTYTFKVLFESRASPYPVLVPVKENIADAKNSSLLSCCFRGVFPRKTKTCSMLSFKKETKVPGDLEVIAIECRFDPFGSDSMILKNIVDVPVFYSTKT